MYSQEQARYEAHLHWYESKLQAFAERRQLTSALYAVPVPEATEDNFDDNFLAHMSLSQNARPPTRTKLPVPRSQPESFAPRTGEEGYISSAVSGFWDRLESLGSIMGLCSQDPTQTSQVCFKPEEVAVALPEHALIVTGYEDEVHFALDEQNQFVSFKSNVMKDSYAVMCLRTGRIVANSSMKDMAMQLKGASRSRFSTADTDGTQTRASTASDLDRFSERSLSTCGSPSRRKLSSCLSGSTDSPYNSMPRAGRTDSDLSRCSFDMSPVSQTSSRMAPSPAMSLRSVGAIREHAPRPEQRPAPFKRGHELQCSPPMWRHDQKPAPVRMSSSPARVGREEPASPFTTSREGHPPPITKLQTSRTPTDFSGFSSPSSSFTCSPQLATTENQMHSSVFKATEKPALPVESLSFQVSDYREQHMLFTTLKAIGESALERVTALEIETPSFEVSSRREDRMQPEQPESTCLAKWAAERPASSLGSLESLPQSYDLSPLRPRNILKSAAMPAILETTEEPPSVPALAFPAFSRTAPTIQQLSDSDSAWTPPMTSPRSSTDIMTRASSVDGDSPMPQFKSASPKRRPDNAQPATTLPEFRSASPKRRTEDVQPVSSVAETVRNLSQRFANAQSAPSTARSPAGQATDCHSVTVASAPSRLADNDIPKVSHLAGQLRSFNDWVKNVTEKQDDGRAAESSNIQHKSAPNTENVFATPTASTGGSAPYATASDASDAETEYDLVSRCSSEVGGEVLLLSDKARDASDAENTSDRVSACIGGVGTEDSALSAGDAPHAWSECQRAPACSGDGVEGLAHSSKLDNDSDEETEYLNEKSQFDSDVEQDADSIFVENAFLHVHPREESGEVSDVDSVVEGAFGWTQSQDMPCAQEPMCKEEKGASAHRRENSTAGDIGGTHDPEQLCISAGMGGSDLFELRSLASARSDEDSLVVHCFRVTGEIGILYAPDSGQVTHIEDGSQAQREGIKVGWQIIGLDDAMYPVTLLQQKIKQGLPFLITFLKKPYAKDAA